MSTALPAAPAAALPLTPADTFLVYRWSNPATTCEHAYLATNAERSLFIAFGEQAIDFDLEFPDEAERWLAEDYTPTAERFTFSLMAIRSLMEQTFAGGVVFGLVGFDDQLAIRRIELSLHAQTMADAGPEYVIDKSGNYQRWYREPDLYEPVTADERELLDVCCRAFGSLAGTFRHLVTAPPTPRYNQAAAPSMRPELPPVA